MDYWKLIELLDQYDKDEWFYDTEERITCKAEWYKIAQIILISKSYGFIQRLVDNDKIDFPCMWDFWKEWSKKAELLLYSIPMKYYKEWYELNIKKEWYLILLCALSIQDNPIEFLCGILK